MASVTIHTGELPSAEGLEGYDLGRVIGRWQSIADGAFPQNCRDLLKMIDETDRFRLWEKTIGGFTFKDRDEFLQEKVLIDFDFTERSLTEIVERLHRGETVALKKLEPHGGTREKANQVDKCQVDQNASGQGGNSAAYTLARLDRDNPELAAKVRAKDLSANAAAIQAGFRKKRNTIDLSAVPQKAAAQIRARFGDEFCAALKSALEQPGRFG